MSIKRGMEVRLSTSYTRGFSRRFATRYFVTLREKKPLASRVKVSFRIVEIVSPFFGSTDFLSSLLDRGISGCIFFFFRRQIWDNLI